jgi:S1-C subfamily serine protease
MIRSGFLACAVALAALAASRPAVAIVGGVESGGAPAAASLMVLSSRGGVCSAVVVASDAVLTAAHCVSGASDYRVHWKGDDGAPVLLEPAAIAIHPGFDAKAIATRRRSIDLALVRVASPLPGRFSPASLGSARLGAGMAVRVGGYGVAREGDARSTGTFRVAELAVVEPYGPSRILLWASGGQTVAGLCTGDSGGPVTDATGAVVALATWATGAGTRRCGALSQAVLLGPQRSWLDGTLAGWGRAATWR